MTELLPEGSIVTWVKPPEQKPRAFEEPVAVSFPTISSGGITLTAVKHPNATVSVKAIVHGQEIKFQAPLPRCDSRGLYIAFRWSTTDVHLYLGGIEPAEEVGHAKIAVH